MNRNPTFQKSLALLAHPACLSALALLLINDHLLRWIWPSWWTGKIGDLAWLTFIPFAVSAGLAWLLPLPEPARERWSFGLGFGLVGFVFGMVKLVPGLSILAMRILGGLLHTSLSIRHDPTDLLALPSLAFGVYLWRSSLGLGISWFRRAPVGLVALPLAALLTLANAAAPDPGISCLEEQDGQILAGAGYTSYSSQDGGQTWQTAALGSLNDCQPDFPIDGQWREVKGPVPGTQYRYMSGQSIQVSTSSDQGWHTGYDLKPLSEARQMYYIKSRPGNVVFEPGPLDALPYPPNRSMLFAMGHQGILVHTAEGDWAWRMVDGYHPLDPFPTPDAFSTLLGGMLYLSLELCLLIYTTLALFWTLHPLRVVVVILAWLGWLLVDFFFPPVTSNGYTQTVTGLGILAVFILLLPLAIEQTIRLVKRTPRILGSLAVFGLAGGLLFLLPYVLWIYSTLPGMLWATIFALLIAAAVLAGGFIFLRRGRTAV